MAWEAPGGPNPRDIELLRIERPAAAAVRKRWRLLPAMLGVVALLGVGGAGYAVYSKTLGRPPEVRTAAVVIKQSGVGPALLTGSGYVVTQHKYIVVGTKILGQIVAEPIEEGQHVRKGDLLARIDDRDYRAQLRQAIADRDLAAANVKLKAAQLARMRELFRYQIESRDQLDVAENALAVAQADLKRAQGAIDYAQFNVGQCVIVSPIDGIVLKKYRELGDTINYGGDIQAGGGTSDIVQLADTADMRVEVDVNESEIAKIGMGTPATVAADAYPDKAFDAYVVKIYPEADRQKGTIKVEVRIRRPDLRIIKPEMSAKVTFLASAPRETTMVLAPKRAITERGGQSSVWTVREGRAYRLAIAAGRDFQDGVEVRQGLSGGELVIIDPPALTEGQRVSAAGS